jgi:hypothetical protein
LKIDSHSAVSISSNFIKNKSLGLMISAEGYEVFFEQIQTVSNSYFKNLNWVLLCWVSFCWVHCVADGCYTECSYTDCSSTECSATEWKKRNKKTKGMKRNKTLHMTMIHSNNVAYFRTQIMHKAFVTWYTAKVL